MLLSRVNVGRSKDPSVGRLVFRVSRYGDKYLRRYLHLLARESGLNTHLRIINQFYILPEVF